MLQKRTATLALLAIVPMALVASLAPCSRIVPAAAADQGIVQPAPRTIVTDPMTWLTRTAYGWEPVELAQPTLWIEGEPHTRLLIERGGEKALVLGR